MLAYPQINPVALAIGPLQIHWYGLMYLVGIGGAWLLALSRMQRFDPTWTKEKLSDMIFWVAMGVIVGGRLGYVLFYDLDVYLANPLLIFEVWKGGMAFHGGLLGVMIATWWFGRRNGKTFFQLMDFIAVWAPGVSATSSTPNCGASRPICRGQWSFRSTVTRPNCRGIRHSSISSRWRAWRCS
jgi:phosphatidylglycerol:prolipoprotein diacylglycerol transferase